MRSVANTTPDTVYLVGQGKAANVKIILDSRNIDLGAVNVGTTKDSVVTIANGGTDTLVVSAVKASDPSLSITPANFKLAGGDSTKITIRFAPTTSGSVIGFLRFSSNGPSDSIRVLARADVAHDRRRGRDRRTRGRGRDPRRRGRDDDRRRVGATPRRRASPPLEPAHRQGHQRLAGVHPVLGLVVDDRVRAVDDVVRDLRAAVGGQAVHVQGVWRRDRHAPRVADPVLVLRRLGQPLGLVRERAE